MSVARFGHLRNLPIQAITAGIQGIRQVQPTSVKAVTNDDLCDLLEAVATSRDRQALCDVFEHFAPRLKAFALRRGIDVGAAEELAQEMLALAIASHASMCDVRADSLVEIERIGGALLEGEAPVAMGYGALSALLNRLEDADTVHGAAPLPTLDAATRNVLPPPLQRDTGRDLDALPWLWVGRLFEEFRLPQTGAGVKAMLIRLAPGSLILRHTHRGQECTLVLAGGYCDGEQAHGRGDFAAKDASDEHQPVADNDATCVCFIALDAPLKLSGAMGALINPFSRL